MPILFHMLKVFMGNYWKYLEPIATALLVDAGKMLFLEAEKVVSDIEAKYTNTDGTKKNSLATATITNNLKTQGIVFACSEIKLAIETAVSMLPKTAISTTTEPIVTNRSVIPING